VRKKAGEFWLAGDNNLVQIEKIASADLIAVLSEVRREGKVLAVSGTFNKSLGMLWYYLRLPRRVMVAIKRRL
jgi:signal peptidase